MTETRSHFHLALNELEVLLLDMAKIAEDQLGEAVEALVTGDFERAHAVQENRDLDDIYVEVERRWHETMALQTPVASDLRLMSLILHTNHSLQRIGAQAGNIARIVEVTAGLPHDDAIIAQVREMRAIVTPMLRTAMEALTKRDIDLALKLPEMDEPADRLNRDMWKAVAACGPNPQLIEWAVHMMLVSRALERIGDRSVDIGEQVAFLLTGEFPEMPGSETEPPIGT